MDELIIWLRAQLDADEQSIRAWEAACVHYDVCFDSGDYLERFGHDRMTADVDAKRRIIDEYFTTGNYDGKLEYELAIFPLLALPYADRPGYREEWRPQASTL